MHVHVKIVVGSLWCTFVWPYYFVGLVTLIEILHSIYNIKIFFLLPIFKLQDFACSSVMGKNAFVATTNGLSAFRHLFRRTFKM